ncbi:MAG TPA: C10 family peptidase [Bacteroidales bacterium]|nr:C10 family peptidase [Bacteroidales bacterium]
MKKIYLTYAFLLLSLALIASPVSIESARKIAQNYFMHYASGKTDYNISNAITRQHDGINIYYVFNFSAGGYILIAADDAAIPVLGYSENGTYNENNLPVQMVDWLDGYATELQYIIDRQLSNKQTIKEWNKILSNDFPESKLVVLPLCGATWNQDGYYNNTVEANTATGVYVGCVATAMGQIMKKWAYPTTGVGVHTYTDATYGVLSVNYGAATYNWASMPNNLTSSNTQVANLLYHCGVAVNMQYSTSGSGAYSQDVPDAIIDHFNYQSSAEIQFQAAFTATAWSNLLKGELDAGRPVLYSGDDGTSGHAFVCDGYNASNQFHFNWGWSGSNNGYFAIGSLNTSNGNFNNNNSAIIRITPPLGAPLADFSANTTTPAVGGSVTFTDYTTNSPTSWNWTFEGGSPASYSGQTPPAITYTTAGNYQVKLTVSNASGTDTKTKALYIRVGGTPSAWIKQNTGFAKSSRGIRNISIVNADVVWAAGYNGISSANPCQDFTKTVNGGATWTPGTITFTGSENFSIANFHAISDQICYACMFPSGENGGYIVKTIDGGATWNIQTSANFSNSWADFVHFFDANNGVCVGDPTSSPYEFLIYTTSNGGSTWTQVPLANIPAPAGGAGETAIVDQFDAYGNTIWFGTSRGKIYKSTDKGLNWTKYPSGSTTYIYTNAQVTPVFKDASTGIVLGVYSADGSFAGVKKTTDGGATWTAITPTGYFVKTPNIDFAPGTTGTWVNVSSGIGLGSSYSTNDCAAFINIDTGSVQYTCVEMLDMETGWAGSFNENAANGGIYKWVNPLTVGTGEHNRANSTIQIYPNPTSGVVNIQFSIFASEKAYITVYNLIGEKVLEKEFDPSFEMLLPLDLSGNVPGMYLVTVQTGSEVTTRRVMLTD